MQEHEIVFNLNKALETEYGEIFLYARQARISEEKNKGLSLLFEKLGLMEVRHADLLSRRIIELGSQPVWNYTLRPEDADIKKIVTQHIEAEAKAIDFYGKLLEQVDPETKILLRGIRAEEEDHLAQLKKYLT